MLFGELHIMECFSENVKQIFANWLVLQMFPGGGFIWTDVLPKSCYWMGLKNDCTKFSACGCCWTEKDKCNVIYVSDVIVNPFSVALVCFCYIIAKFQEIFYLKCHNLVSTYRLLYQILLKNKVGICLLLLLNQHCQLL